MLHLLRRNEKESLRSRLLDGLLLYKAFQKPIREFEAEATGFRLSPEEVFWQVVVVLDKVKEYQEDALIDIRGLWDDIYVDYRDLSDDEDGLDLFTAITVFCVQTCLVMLNAPLYRTMTSIIGEQLAKHNQPSHRIEAAVLNNITRIGTDKFKTSVQVYMNSEDDWLSDEIEEILDNTPTIQQEIPQKKEENETKTIQLTNRQLMILFDLFLNKGFSTEFCNQKALATLLSRVSGRSEGSIRQKIREGVDYEIEDVCNDVNMLAQLLEPIDKTLAEKMKNLLE